MTGTSFNSFGSGFSFFSFFSFLAFFFGFACFKDWFKLSRVGLVAVAAALRRSSIGLLDCLKVEECCYRFFWIRHTFVQSF